MPTKQDGSFLKKSRNFGSTLLLTDNRTAVGLRAMHLKYPWPNPNQWLQSVSWNSSLSRGVASNDHFGTVMLRQRAVPRHQIRRMLPTLGQTTSDDLPP